MPEALNWPKRSSHILKWGVGNFCYAKHMSTFLLTFVASYWLQQNPQIILPVLTVKSNYWVGECNNSYLAQLKTICANQYIAYDIWIWYHTRTIIVQYKLGDTQPFRDRYSINDRRPFEHNWVVKALWKDLELIVHA